MCVHHGGALAHIQSALVQVVLVEQRGGQRRRVREGDGALLQIAHPADSAVTSNDDDSPDPVWLSGAGNHGVPTVFGHQHLIWVYNGKIENVVAQLAIVTIRSLARL